MGKRIEVAKSDLLGAASSRIGVNEAAARAQREGVLAAEERLLGTDAQVNGTLQPGLSQSEIPYAGRYTLDEGSIRNLATGKNALKVLQPGVASANALMEQAQAAARAGNLQGAEQLRAQAESAIFAGDGKKKLYLQNPEAWKPYVTLGAAPAETQAASQLSSPLAQTVGRSLQTARAFANPMSEESARLLGVVQGAPVAALDQGEASARAALGAGRENALRGVDAAARDADRAARDQAASRGSFSSPFAERAMRERSLERFSAQRATVETQAAQDTAQSAADFARERASVLQSSGQFFEQFRTQFAFTAVDNAQRFLTNQSGIREQYQGALDQLNASVANFTNAAADRHFEFARMEAQIEQQREEFRLGRKAFFEQLGAGLLTGGASSGAGKASASYSAPRSGAPPSLGY